jgi:hypothetical protein
VPEGQNEATKAVDTVLVGKSNTGDGDDALEAIHNKMAWPTWLREAINYLEKVTASSAWARIIVRLVEHEETFSLNGTVSLHHR